MPRSPAVIIIARHGARLDAADQTWHLTSPTPYDPPLTYGGWSQSKALGLRIASLLQAREEALNEEEEFNTFHFGRADEHTDPNARPTTPKIKRGKHKVVIHSSPFLRCTQTAVGVGAGLASFKSAAHQPTHHKTHVGKLANQPFRASPRLHAVDADSPWLHATNGHDHSKGTGKDDHERASIVTKLRIDPFLGEWMTPDYFERVTCPPDSRLMVAGAKGELLRRGDEVAVVQSGNYQAGNFPGGWKQDPKPAGAHASPINMADLNHHLPRRERTGSVSSTMSAGHRGITSTVKTEGGLYISPVPSYPVLPTATIPAGYVAHARDACVDTDFRWDSLKEPLEWGNGGELGEEWSQMHKRLRKGLHHMIEWYTAHGLETPLGDYQNVVHGDPEEDDDESTDLVLVLVTHASGCNALVGGLTNQPVLMDFGLASLTMAVKNEWQVPTSPTSPYDGRSSPLSQRRRTSVDIGLAHQYEMRLTASTEHLRKGVDPSYVSMFPSSKTAPPLTELQRRKSSYTGNLAEHMQSVNASLGSIRRSSTSASSSRPHTARSRPSPSNSGGSGGLWSRTPLTPASVASTDGLADVPSDSERDLGLTRNTSVATGTSLKTIVQGQVDEDLHEPQEPQMKPKTERSYSGLWGGPPQSGRTPRDRGPKRRWTVNENDGDH
ncbi:hypothetical protein K402DRAFT_451879 [Aulographum hederae CBS 113979]|uniref:Phosphoglycerate mutase-like protein n=1 Tax=Aulographum hederae CBS 113979 TaxID=1176131 RepID=A0A6G1H9E5_9PEZI|nr:hypothetical protein K402DRAFT_451879 [Aulographum hederae CBS 113979]